MFDETDESKNCSILSNFRMKYSKFLKTKEAITDISNLLAQVSWRGKVIFEVYYSGEASSCYVSSD